MKNGMKIYEENFGGDVVVYSDLQTALDNAKLAYKNESESKNDVPTYFYVDLYKDENDEIYYFCMFSDENYSCFTIWMSDSEAADLYKSCKADDVKILAYDESCITTI